MKRRQSKISLPAVLLVIASALSCSTACVAPLVVTAGAVAASVGSATNKASLEKNRASRLGSAALPAVTGEPASIEEALLPALPSSSAGSKPDPKRLNVVLLAQQPGEAEVKTYEIKAYDKFTPDNAQTFASFANRIRSQLPGRVKFIIYAYKDASDGPKLVSRLEVD